MSIKCLSFNILSTTLSKNPFEFESQYRGDSTYHKNLKLVFDVADLIMNPKSKLKGKSVKISHFFPDQSILRDCDIERYVQHLKGLDKSVDPGRLEDLRNMEVKYLVSLFDKSNKNAILMDYCLSTIDRKTHLVRFYDESSMDDLESKKSKLRTPGEEKDFVYIILNLIILYVLNKIHEFFYFNEFKNIKNVRLTQDQVNRAFDILVNKIINSTTSLEDFHSDRYTSDWLRSFYADYNESNTPQYKFSVILDYMNKNKVDVATLIEISQEIYQYLPEMVQGKYDYHPKNFTFEHKGDFLTLSVFNKERVSKVEDFHLVDSRTKIVKISSVIGSETYLAQVHLAAGEEFAEARLNEVSKLLDGVQPNIKEHLYICGDFNENLDVTKGVLKKLSEFGFEISQAEDRLKKETCDKMRSPIQFQVNKMRKMDISTKDAIFALKYHIEDKDYDIVYQKISDHKMVVAVLK